MQFGLRLEPGFLITEENKSTEISFSPFSVYLSAAYIPIDWLNIEVRPGYFAAGEEYSGLEFGAFCKFIIPNTKFQIIAGFNNHNNTGTGHNGGGSIEKNILYKGIGIGFNKDSKLYIDLMYYWTNDKEFAYTGYPISYKKMNGILKIGIGFAWNIL